MQRFLTIAAAALCAAFLTPVAHAQFYVGAQAGVGFMSTEVTAGGTDIDGIGSRGALLGARIGWDAHLANSPVFFGVLADYSWSNMQFSVNSNALTATVNDKWGGSARIGYTMAGGQKLYLLGGLDRMDATWGGALAAGLPSMPAFNGWHAGGGIEIPLTKVLDFTIEPRYTDFNTAQLGKTGVSFKPRELEAMGVLSFHFPVQVSTVNGYTGTK